MNFSELAETRYSVRKYQDKPVSKEDLEKIL
ncbi:MAG: nitroreductase family protein [Treponema sp.]|nr:nitroreductase family protein [Treponema sp.]